MEKAILSRAALWRVLATCPAGWEGAVSDSFEQTFGIAPCIYTNADNGRSEISVFLPNAASARKKLTGLRRAIGAFAETARPPAPYRVVLQPVPRQDWAESWKKHFKSFCVGRSLLVKPPWSERKPARGQATVVIEPGLSFGTGQHPTTRFCLRQIERLRPTRRPKSMLDIGTGSGILAIAAAKLGYAPVVAFDVDPDAVRIAAENVMRNQATDLVCLRQADLARLPEKTSQKFDILCANLIHDVLIAECHRMVNRLKPNGMLVLAGILRGQFEKVKNAYSELGFNVLETSASGEWRSGRFGRQNHS